VAEGLTSGTKFTDIDLSEKDWVEYDEKAGVSAGIFNVEYELTLEKTVQYRYDRTPPDNRRGTLLRYHDYPVYTPMNK